MSEPAGPAGPACLAGPAGPVEPEELSPRRLNAISRPVLVLEPNKTADVR